MGNFSVPTLVVGKNSGGLVSSTNKVVGINVPAANQLAIGITTSADTSTVTSVVDSKSNVWKLVGVVTTTVNRPITVYKCWVTTPLVANTDTITVNTSASTIINFICVVVPGVVGTEPLTGTFSSSTGTTATETISSLQVNDEYLLAFENNGSSSPTWSSPAVALDTESGGGGPFFTASYTAAGRSGAAPTTTWGVATTWSIAALGTLNEYTDLYTDAYGPFYGNFTGTPFPLSGGLLIVVEILLNGTWTDITSYVYQRDGSVQMDMEHGRPDESNKFVTATMQLQLNNMNGTFSSKNTASQFYPYITRNTQIRASFQADVNNDDAGYTYHFWGEVASWPSSWDLTGNDIWTNITASGISRRLGQQATLGSAIRRYYMRKDPTDPTFPISYWPCEDGSSSTQIAEATGAGSAGTFTGSPTLASDTSFGGSDPIPVLNGAVITLNTASFNDSGLALYQVPGTYSFMPRNGLTSLTSVECWGAGGGGTNGYHANTGQDAAGGGGEYAKDTTVAISLASSYTVVVGAGGAGGPLTTNVHALPSPTLQQRVGGNGGNSSFAGDAVTTTAHGGKGGTFSGSRGGQGGSGSTAATHHNGGNGGQNSGSFFGGSGGGGSGGTSAAGNNGGNGGGSNTGAAGGVAVTGGAAGGKGGNGGASVDQGGTAGSFPGGGGGSGGENSNNSASHGGGNGAAGQVKLIWTPLVTPTVNNVRFICGIPNAGDVNNTVLLRFISGGKVVTTDVIYTTAAGGSLTILGKDVNGTQLFTSSGSITGVNGQDMFISAELYVAGGGVGFAIRVLNLSNLGSGSGQTAGTAAASGSVGPVSQIILNPGGLGTAYSAGHVTLQYTNEDWAKINNDPFANIGPISGWFGELAGRRFQRLCTEEGVPFEFLGDVHDTVAMGSQPDAKLIDALQEVEDLDRGFLYEAHEQFGMGYRTYKNVFGQTPKLIADYSKAQISPPFQPTEDDQLTRNYIVVTRKNGSSVVAQLSTGSMSTQDPPNGVGQYLYAITVNAANDSDLLGVANKILALGTVDDERHPTVVFDLTRPSVQPIFGIISGVNEGDYMQILNPLSPVITGTIKQLVVGFKYEISAFKYLVTFNCIPESPFE